MTTEAGRRPRRMRPDDHRRTCWCGHRYGDHATGGTQCLAIVDDPDNVRWTGLCQCHQWEPREVSGYEHGPWCVQSGRGDEDAAAYAFAHGEACHRDEAPPEVLHNGRRHPEAEGGWSVTREHHQADGMHAADCSCQRPATPSERPADGETCSFCGALRPNEHGEGCPWFTPSERPADGSETVLADAPKPLDADEIAMLRRWSATVRAGGPRHDEERLRWADDVARLLATLDATPADPERRSAQWNTSTPTASATESDAGSAFLPGRRTTTTSERPIDIVWALARESLAQRDKAETAGWAMTPMPHEAEVRALLATPADPERRSVTVEGLDDVVIEARRNLHDGNYVDPRPLLDMIERLAAAIPQDATPAGLDVERVRRAFRLIQRWPPDRDSAEVFAEAYLAATDTEGIASAGGPEQSEHPE